MPNYLSQLTQPAQVSLPQSNFSNQKPRFFILVTLLLAVIAIITIILLNYFGLISISRYIPQLKFLPVKVMIIAEVNGQKIYKDELENAKVLFSTLDGKDRSDPEVAKKALDFVIDTRLLAEEARKRGVDISETVEKRFQASTEMYGATAQTYKNYLLNQAIKEALIPIAVQWRLVDYLSIRYIWNVNVGAEEAVFKETAFKKAQEYYNKIINGLDIREAIKQRCQDPAIDYYPFEDHLKVYSKTFDGKICREQRLDFYVSKENNPDWDEWLKEVFKYHKGEVSKIIQYEKKPSLGMYFIVKILDEGQGTAFSIDELIQNLGKTANIKIYKL